MALPGSVSSEQIPQPRVVTPDELARLKSQEASREKRPSFNFIRDSFQDMLPLIRMLQGNPETAVMMDDVLGDPEVRSVFIRHFSEDLKDVLARKETETDPEKLQKLKLKEDYINSVDVLSRFNPFFVAAILANRGVVREYLQYHFETTSERTKAELEDGGYDPTIVIGAGIHSSIAMGEIARLFPNLAAGALVVDSAQYPGGPFNMPLGKA